MAGDTKEFTCNASGPAMRHTKGPGRMFTSISSDGGLVSIATAPTDAKNCARGHLVTPHFFTRSVLPAVGHCESGLMLVAAAMTGYLFASGFELQSSGFAPGFCIGGGCFVYWL